MKNNKFISLLLALTMILSSLSGLTVITASANETPALTDFDFTDYYSTEFDYADQSDASVINADADDAWTWSDPVGFTLARGYKIYKQTFSMKWKRWTQYNIPTDSAADVIGFKYTMQTKGSEQYVSIVDSDDTVVQLLDQSAASDEAKTFTTVIDTTVKKIYTFMPDSTVAENSYTGDTVKAIRFGNTSNESDFIFLISDFAYMTGEKQAVSTDEPTDEPTEEPTSEPTNEPTAEPTDVPTPDPTGAPTSDQTAEPTDVPTPDPTGAPTSDPTAEPTAEPTDVPTPDPTAEPTAIPTPDPTAEPTAEPTIGPADSADEGLGFWNIFDPTYNVENDKTDMKAASEAKYGDWTGQRAFTALLAQSGDDYLGFAWNRWLQYNKAPETGIYYYKYTIEMSANQLARLVDTTVNGTASSLSDNYPLVTSENVTGKATFTTIVDADNKVAYTYDISGELVGKVNFSGSTLKGIQFASVDNVAANVFRLYAFEYGIASDPTRPTPTPAPTAAPTPEPTEEPVALDSKLSDWSLEAASATEGFDGKSITALQENDWKFGNTNAGANFNEKHVIINGSGELEINWYGTATYGLTDENESYYYTYTVKTKDTSGIRSVNLSGVDEGTMLVSGKDITSAEKTFTTVVDINSKKAYTYDNSTGDFVSVVDVPNPSAVKGITFSGGLVNTNVGMQVDNVSYGLVNIEAETPSKIIVTSDDVNDGSALETTGNYSVGAEKFTDTVITFDEPVSRLEDGKVPLYITTALEIKAADGTLPSAIKVDGLTITASEGLTEGTYPLSIVAKATFKGETLLTQSYTVNIVKAKVTDQDIIDEYEPVITTQDSDGNKEVVKDGDTIDTKLSLPTKTSFANISWKAYKSGTTDETDIISSNGAVTRPLDDTQVTLVAAITDPSDPDRVIDTKEITLTVKGVGDMLKDAISKAKAAIVSADTGAAVTLSDLHEDITLYTKYDNDEYAEYKDVAFTWTSDSDVLRVDGSVARIYPTDTKAFNVNLAVKASALGAEMSEVIPVTVLLTKANAGDKYAVRCDDLAESNFEDVSVHSNTTVSDDIDVPTEGLFGSLISWNSSVPMYMSNTGEYTAPSNNTKVTMTGIVSKGKVISTNKHSYTFTVKGKKKDSQSGGSGGGSSSGGSSYTMPSLSGSYTPVTSVPASNSTANTDTKGFKDLGNVSWAADAINALSDKGVVSGRDENTFDPDANITRAEFATIIVKAFGIPYTGAVVDEFADVNAGDWYYSFVAAAYHAGIIAGYDNGSFGAYDNITRQDMAVIIYRAAQAANKALDEVKDAKTFSDDASISDYAADAVYALVKAGVINGMSDTEFAPGQNATRAQVAKMTYELVK